MANNRTGIQDVNDLAATAAASTPVAHQSAPLRVSDGEIDAATLETGRRLAKYPKVRIRVPLPPGMSEVDVKEMVARGEKAPNVPVAINGYIFQVRLGDDVVVPEPVANVLRRANRI